MKLLKLRRFFLLLSIYHITEGIQQKEDHVIWTVSCSAAHKLPFDQNEKLMSKVRKWID